jgi:predicted transposase YdaD
VKTDTLFYQLFQEFPWIFFQLIQREQTNLNAYQFIAPEIKQRSFRLDGLFTTTEEYSDQPLYFLEVQFYQEVEAENSSGELARNLIERIKQELTDTTSQKHLLELIETIIIYKFPQLSYQEIETMLNLEEIKQSRVYQDAKSEGKFEQKIAMIPVLQELGLNVEQIAQRLEIEENLVRENLK